MRLSVRCASRSPTGQAMALRGAGPACFPLAGTATAFALTRAMLAVRDDPIMVLLPIDVAPLVPGCVMDMAALILIATPIYLPVVTAIGMDPARFGTVMMMNPALGLATRAVGAEHRTREPAGNIPAVRRAGWTSALAQMRPLPLASTRRRGRARGKALTDEDRALLDPRWIGRYPYVLVTAPIRDRREAVGLRRVGDAADLEVLRAAVAEPLRRLALATLNPPSPVATLRALTSAWFIGLLRGIRAERIRLAEHPREAMHGEASHDWTPTARTPLPVAPGVVPAASPVTLRPVALAPQPFAVDVVEPWAPLPQGGWPAALRDPLRRRRR
jgi:hypothetical protein